MSNQGIDWSVADDFLGNLQHIEDAIFVLCAGAGVECVDGERVDSAAVVLTSYIEGLRKGLDAEIKKCIAGKDVI